MKESKGALVVDDEEGVRNLHRRLLRRGGFDVVHMASNGEEGLWVLTAHGPFDLVITDGNMPIRDGLWLIECLKALPKHRQPKRIILASSDEAIIKDVQERWPDVGILEKPYGMAQFNAAVFGTTDSVE